MYGKKFNGYMGVGIAVPTEKYNIVSTDITTIADTKKFQRKEKQNFIAVFLITLLRKIGLSEKPIQVYEIDVLMRVFVCVCVCMCVCVRVCVYVCVCV